jgi:hypothetical protein
LFPPKKVHIVAQWEKKIAPPTKGTPHEQEDVVYFEKGDMSYCIIMNKHASHAAFSST